MPTISASDIIVSGWKNTAVSNFNGSETIKYYIHDTQGYQYNLNTNPNGWTYTYPHYTGEENYIDYIFNSIDPYISLDFERVNTASEGDIDIYMLGDWFSPSSLGLTYITNNKTEIFWYESKSYNFIGYQTLQDNDAFTLIHEVGHALGLSHPQLNGSDDPYGNWHNSNDTVMSYNYISSSNPPNWQAIDIQALQNIWGLEDNTAPLITGPSGSAGASNSSKIINENTLVVDTFTANETVVWSINGGNDPTFFSINSSSGLLIFNSAPDYENKIDSNFNGIYSIYVKATDNAGNYSNQWVEVTIADVDESNSPTNISLSSSSFNENIESNSTIAELSTTDPDSSDTHTYSLVSGSGDTDNNSFTIDGSSLKINSSPDYETQSSYTIRLKTTDGGGNNYEKLFTLSVNDIEEGDIEKPIIYGQNNLIISSSSTTIDIPEGTNSEIYRFTANEEVSWSISQNAGINDYQYFSIDEVTGSLKINGDLDYENSQASGGNNLYSMSINATDTSDNVLTQAFEINITDVVDESNTSSIVATSTELQQLYIGYFGRPCDPDGLDYWLGDKVTRKSFAENMYVQPEFNSVNGSLSTRNQVNQMYLNLFNRDGDDAGLDYWSGQVESGILELASIANDLTWAALNNAGSEVDKKTLTHKTNAAIQYTYEIRKSDSDKLAYQPDSTSPWVTGDNLTEGKRFINEIGYSKVATLSEVQESIGKFNSASSRYELIASDYSQSRIDPITGITLDTDSPKANEEIKYGERSDQLNDHLSITHVYDDTLYRNSEIAGQPYLIGHLHTPFEKRYEDLTQFSTLVGNQLLIGHENLLV